MANNLTSFSPELWSARTQILLKNNLVGAAISNTEERAALTYGTRVHRPYHSEIYSQPYVKGTAVSFLDVSTTDEYLDVDQANVVPIYVDDIDRIQNKYKTIDLLSERAAYEMRDKIDRTVLAQVSNAALGNSTPVSLSTSNVVSTFSTAKADLFNNGVEESKPWYVVADSDTVSVVEQFMTSNGFKVADEVIDNGYGLAAYLGEFLGLQWFKSQNLPSTAVLTTASDPTTGQVVTINGITFTCVDTIGATPGNFLHGGSADAARAALAGLINNPDVTSSTQVALSASNVAKLKRRGVAAVNDNGADTLTVTAAGKMTLGSLTWTAGSWGTQTMKLLVGQMGGIDLVLQQDVNAEIARAIAAGKIGTNILTWALYGTKMFNEGKQRTYALTKNV